MRLSAALAAAGLAAAAGGCSLPLAGPERFPAAHSRLAVTPYRQAPELCGPYALAAALAFLGIPSDAEEMGARLRLPSAGGTLTMDLFLEARRKGAGTVVQGEGSLEELRVELERGRPVLLLLRYPAVKGGHFILVTGDSPSPPGFFLLWGNGRESWMGEEVLMALWERSGRWRLRFSRE